jgi:F-type H+-transporting ATPase subunit a
MSLGLTRELTSIQPEIIFSIGNFGIANSTLMIVFMIIGFLILGVHIKKRFGVKPTSFQVIMELLYTGIMDLVTQITGDEKHAKKIFPVIATILVYFALANVIAIIPGLTDITYKGVALLRTPTSDFNTAFGVSLAAVLVLNYVSVKEWGIFGYLGNFFNFKGIYLGFKKSFMDGFIGMVEFFVGVLNIIGELAKVISLTFRLFGNIYAGQVLAIIIMGAVAYVLPTVWSLMSNFTGLLQGFVFAALVAVYYTLSLKPEDVEKDA